MLDANARMLCDVLKVDGKRRFQSTPIVRVCNYQVSRSVK